MRRLVVIIAMVAAISVLSSAKIKVACVGNSITYGHLLPDRETQSYPAQLQRLLGEEYEVGNFGRSGTTLLRRGHRPYVEQEEYKQAIEFAGDIVVIHLGINDTDPRDWPNYGDEFMKDYVSLIDSFRLANPGCRIIIARLTPILSFHPRFESGTRDWRNEIQSAIESVARLAGVETVDFDAALQPYPNTLPDAVHPNPQGAKKLATAVYSTITGDFGGLQMPAVYTDGMVLQRDCPLKIRGKADAGTMVTVSVAGQETTAATGLDGNWEAILQPLTAGGPYTMEINDGTMTLSYSDVLVGEVWLCSGQSNMEFTLRQSATGSEDIPDAENDQIRFYDTKARWRTNAEEWPLEALDFINNLQYMTQAVWEKSTPGSASRFSAVAYYFGKMLQDSLKVPVGLICNAVGGSPAEAWIERRTLESEFPSILRDWRKNDFIQEWVRQRAELNIAKSADRLQRHPYEPSYLYDAAIRTLGQYPIKGVIWYQGESNAHNADAYARLMKILVDNWRKNWENGQLPFYYVQLSSIDRPSWPLFRDRQRRLADEIESVGMAVSSDLGDSLDVHPKQKKQIGERLARLALNKTYHMETITPCGPLFRSTEAVSGAVYVKFDYGAGLHSSDGKEIRTFEVAETEGLYYEAVAEPVGECLKVYSPQVANPRYVRYGWQPFTRANLVNSDGLPASTFRAEAAPKLLEVSSVDIMNGFPREDTGFAKGVSACTAGIIDGFLVMAGGCNFPDVPAADGGSKRFYDAIYAARLGNDNLLEWVRVGALPRPVAYGVSVIFGDALILAGGSNAYGLLTDVVEISLDDGVAEVKTLPSLPVAIDNASGCVADSVFYIVGGNVNGVPSNCLWSLDLRESDKGWQRLSDFPGNPRVQPVCAAQRDAEGNMGIYVWGGFAGKADGRDASLEVDGVVYSPSLGDWHQLPAPVDERGETISLGGGVAVAVGNSTIACLGGVNKDIFLAALQAQEPDYMTHPAEWYRFNRCLSVYDTEKDEWQVVATSIHFARAGAALVTSSNQIICICGELKPGVRTPQITRIIL